MLHTKDLLFRQTSCTKTKPASRPRVLKSRCELKAGLCPLIKFDGSPLSSSWYSAVIKVLNVDLASCKSEFTIRNWKVFLSLNISSISPGAFASRVDIVFSVSDPRFSSRYFKDSTLGGMMAMKFESGKAFSNLIAPCTSISSKGILFYFWIAVICDFAVPYMLVWTSQYSMNSSRLIIC